MVDHDYQSGDAVVSFTIPDHLGTKAVQIPVRFYVRPRPVYQAMYGQEYWACPRNDGFLKQAERVAWRQLILWVDAALSAAAIGLQTISEAFMAHTLIKAQDGTIRRFVDHLDELQDWKSRLLTSGS